MPKRNLRQIVMALALCFFALVNVSCRKSDPEAPAPVPAVTDSGNDPVRFYCWEFISASGNYHPTPAEKASGLDCFDTATAFTEANGYETLQYMVRQSWQSTTDAWCVGKSGQPYNGSPFFRIYKVTESGMQIDSIPEDATLTNCP